MTDTDEAAELDDASGEGEAPIRSGTARAALAHRDFRVLWLGAFASHVGSWAQNIILGAYAYELTGSASYVGLLVFAQLGPSLLLSMVGGLVADRFERRRVLLGVSVEQMLFSIALAAVVATDDPSRLSIFLLVLAIGIGQSMYAPTYSALLPSLVPRRDLAGAISLNSAQLNASRVIGPAIGGLLLAWVGPEWVFLGNAATYLFVIAALLAVHPRPRPVPLHGESALRQLTGGVRYARADRVVGRCLVTVFLFSLLSLTFVGQLAVVADENIGIDADSGAFGLLYACFGLGALAGALSIGTVLSRQSKTKLVRITLAGYSICLTVFALIRNAPPAYPAVAILGAFYFAMITSLLTSLQERLDDTVRGRVMALWIMGFGGTVSIGNLIAGPIIDSIGVTWVMLFGAVASALLAWYADIEAPKAEVRPVLVDDPN